MAVTGDLVSANITTDDGKLFQIRPDGAGAHVVQELDTSKFQAEAEPIGVTDTEVASRDAVANDDGSVIDVMVVYTAAARLAAGGAAAMDNLIQLGIAETNQGYANSGVIQRVRLVHSEEISYAESGDANTDLRRLKEPADGYLDNVHALRDAYGADIVSLWVENLNACGVGYLMTSLATPFASSAFNVVARNCATGNYTFGHEMGHNMGCAHDRANSNGAGVFPYSYGYQQKTVSPFFRDIMAYACSGGVYCQRISYWSNPAVTYAGIPTGVDISLPDAADTHLTLNNTRIVSANWRSSTPGSIVLSPPSASFPSTGGTGTISVTTGVSWSAVSSASWIAITAGVSGSGNGVITYSVAANVLNASRTGTIGVNGQSFTVSQSGVTAPCTTAVIGVGQTVTGSLSSSDCLTPLGGNFYADRYIFNAVAGQHISIELNSSAFDAYLTLLGPNGEVLASDDDGGGNLNARIPAGAGFIPVPVTGAYTIEASSALELVTGAYTLRLLGQGSCSYSVAPASRVVDGNTQSGTVGVSAPVGCAWTASSNVAWIQITSAGTGVGNGTVTYTVLANTTAASRTATVAIASQVFVLTQATLSGCSTKSLGFGQTATGSLTSSSCASLQFGAGFYADRYTFNASVGQQVAITLTSPTLDTYLFLLGPDGKVIAQDDDGAGNLNSRIPATNLFFTLPVSGTFTIEATTFDPSAAGAYTLSLVTGAITSVQLEGALDAAECSTIYGWAWDKGQPNAVVNVEIYDGATLLGTVLANQFRADLLAVGKGNGLHGFSFPAPANLRDGQVHSIRVRISGAADDVPGSPRLLSCAAGAQFDGAHDYADCNVIYGWAWDKNRPNEPVNVDIYEGSNLLVTVPASDFRPDLLNSGKGNGYHGFALV